MTRKEQILQYHQLHPDQNAAQIGRALKLDKSTVRFYINPIYQANQIAQKAKRSKRYKLSLIQQLGGKCQSCNYDKCLDALDFHHLDPKIKDFGLAQKRHASLAILTDEAKKCILLCCRCHRELHAGILDLSFLKLKEEDTV